MYLELRATLPVLMPLFLGYGLMQMGNTLQGTLLSVRGGLEGFSPFEIGLIGAGFWLGLVLGSLRSGGLIRRVGHTRVFAALASVSSAAPLLHLMHVDPVVWTIERALTGFCFAGLFMVVESWLNSASNSGIRGQVLSLYGMIGLVAGISGQMLLPTYDPAGFQLFSIVSIIISLALVPVTLSRASAPPTCRDGRVLVPSTLGPHRPVEPLRPDPRIGAARARQVGQSGVSPARAPRIAP